MFIQSQTGDISELTGEEARRLARRAQDRYENAADAQRTWANEAADCIEYYFGAHWTNLQRGELLSRGQQPISIEIMYQIVEQAVGMLTAKNPSFRAVGRETSDVRMAAMWADLHQWMWQKSRGKQRFVNIVRDNYVQGRGVAYAYTDWNADFGQGEVVWIDIDPKDVAPDPRATDPLWDDASDVHVRRLFTLGQIKTTWGEEVANLIESQGKSEEGYRWSPAKQAHHGQIIHQQDINASYSKEDDQYEIIETFEKVKIDHWRVFNPDSAKIEILTVEKYDERRTQAAYVITKGGQDQMVTNPEEVAQVDELFNSVGAIFHVTQGPPSVDPQGQMVPNEYPVPGLEAEDPNAVQGTETVLQPVTMGELIDDGRIPAFKFLLDRIKAYATSGHVLLYSPMIMPISHYPIVPFPNTANRHPYPTSDVTRMRDLQDLVNKTTSLILAWQATATNQKVFYPEGTIRDLEGMKQDWGAAGTAMIPYETAFGVGGSSPGGIVIAHPSPLPVGIFEARDRAIGLMERIAGIYATQQGEQSMTQETFRSILAREEQGTTRMRHKLVGIHGSLERLGQVMTELAQATYTTEKTIRITSAQGEHVEHRVNYIDYDDYSSEAGRINDLAEGYYDMQIVPGSTLDSNRWAKIDTYLQLYDRGIVDDQAVVSETDLPNGWDILERNSIRKQMVSAMQEMEGQIKELSGDLQTWQREALHADKRTELEKFKTRMARLEASASGKVKEFSVRLDAEREVIAAKEKVQTTKPAAAK